MGAFGKERWIVVSKARYLRMLAPFVCKDEARFFLQGVWIEPKGREGALLVSTDGYRLGVVFDKAGLVKAPFICPLSKELLRQCEQLPDHGVVFSGSRVYIVDDVEKAKTPRSAGKRAVYYEELPPIDGVFPSWKQVIPTYIVKKQAPFCMNAAYMGDFVRVSRAAGLSKDPDSSKCWHLYQTRVGAGALVARHEEIGNFFGMLMPMKSKELPAALPWWLPPREKGERV